MKKLALIITTLLLSVSVFAQEDVTKFLGIPVDGFKPEMIRKLKAKGFVEHPYKTDELVGEFNGRDVEVAVVTNNNKVYMIFLRDRYASSETDIKIRFNTLCRQFTNNKNYITFSEQAIPEDEDISYEMSVNNKRYEAAFYQVPESLDTAAIQRQILPKLIEEYGKEQLANASEELQADEFLEKVLRYTFELVEKKTVWFMIVNESGSYRILMYYDNKSNQANGEDL